MKKTVSLFLTMALLLCCFAAAGISANAAKKLEPGYYVVGSFNDWSLDRAYRMQSAVYDRDSDRAEYYLLKGLRMNEGDELKVTYSEDGVNRNAWYPDSGPQTNYVIQQDAYYDVALALPTDGTSGCWDWQLWVEPCDPPTDKPDPTEPEPVDHTKELWESGTMPTAADIEDAVNEQFNSHQWIGVDEITVYNAYRFNCTPAYIIDYGVEGYGYYCEVITEEYFGDYLFYSSSSYEPSIYADDRLYPLTKAYEAGILTQEMLAELVETDYSGGGDHDPNSCRILYVGKEVADGGSDSDDLSKLSPALIKEISDPTDVMIEVYIFLKDCPDKWRVDEIVSQKYTWSDEQEHLMYYRREMAATIGPYVQQFIDDNAELIYRVLCQIDSAEFIIAEVSKENVHKLAQLDIVQEMDTYGAYSEPVVYEPDIAGMLAEAANELYFDPRNTITPRDITVRDYYQFSETDIYAVCFTVRNLQYTADMLEEKIGDWLLVCSRPEPYLFVDNRLYGFKEAYDAGIMTDDMLGELGGSYFLNCKTPILTRYIKGDADGDGEVSVIDATVIQRYDANIAVTGAFYEALADVDGDSEVSIIDATLIQRYEAGLYVI